MRSTVFGILCTVLLLASSAQSYYTSNVPGQKYLNTNCVAFRLDDIQDYYLTKTQVAIMDVFKANKTPITVGVIAHAFNIGDVKMIGYLMNAVTDPAWNFEVANHGWKHEQFSSYSLQDQTTLMRAGVNKTLTDFAGIIEHIPTFIAPFNNFNEDTLTAAKTVGFKAFSAQIQTDIGPNYPYSGEALYHWPTGTSTTDLGDETEFIGIPWNVTFAQLQQQIAVSGFASVMMHMYEFAHVEGPGNYSDVLNQTMFDNLNSLLAAITSAGYRFCTLGDIADRFAALQATNWATTGFERPQSYSGQLGVPIPQTHPSQPDVVLSGNNTMTSTSSQSTSTSSSVTTTTGDSTTATGDSTSTTGSSASTSSPSASTSAQASTTVASNQDSDNSAIRGSISAVLIAAISVMLL